MIRLNNVSKSFGEIDALNNVSLEVPEGQLLGFLGPNGAGKSTTLNILTSLQKPDNGEVYIDGINLEQNRALIKRKIGLVPQEISLYEELSAWDNLMFWGQLYGVPGSELKRKIQYGLEMTELWKRRKDPIKTFSGGMQRRVNILASILHDPKILLLDEPTVGIDPQSRNHIFKLIETLNDRGITIIYTTHYMEEVERLCEKVAIINEGEIVITGSLHEVKSRFENKNMLKITTSEISDVVSEQIKKSHDAEINGNVLNVRYKDLRSEILSLIDLLKGHDLEVLSVGTRQPNLESIFLELTGKQLSDRA